MSVGGTDAAERDRPTGNLEPASATDAAERDRPTGNLEPASATDAALDRPTGNLEPVGATDAAERDRPTGNVEPASATDAAERDRPSFSPSASHRQHRRAARRRRFRRRFCRFEVVAAPARSSRGRSSCAGRNRCGSRDRVYVPWQSRKVLVGQADLARHRSSCSSAAERDPAGSRRGEREPDGEDAATTVELQGGERVDGQLLSSRIRSD